MINRNVIVPIPEDANHPHKAKRVFITLKKNYDSKRQFNINKRVVIGEAVSDTEMYPNEAYMNMYPEIYAEHAPHEQVRPAVTKIIGPYAAFLAVGQHTGLYKVLYESFGVMHANAIMDYCMYSILTHSNVAKDFFVTMEKHVLFSDKAYSDTWLSEFFKVKMTDEQGLLFRENWIKHCHETGIDSAWICIDGSNDDCDGEANFLAEEGHDKSGQGGPIVSYMWAVSTKDGTPITYSVYRGSRIDSVALKETVAFMAEHGIKTEGVILDRGFWTLDDILLLSDKGFDFIMMVKSGEALTSMIEMHGQTLRNQDVHYMLQRSGSYGIVDQVKVFKNYDREMNVALMYNNKSAVSAVNDLTDTVKKELSAAKKKIDAGASYTIDKSVAEFIEVTKHRGRGKDTLSINEEKLQKAVNSKGFAALAISREMTAQETDDLYALRQYSEKQYSAFKTQLGYDVLRVYSQTSWESKFAVGFAAGILRNAFEAACLKADADTNLALKELDHVQIYRIRDDFYVYVRMMTIKAKAVLSQLGIIEDDMQKIADKENQRLNGPYHHPIHSLPKREAVKRKPGRPAGSKNLKPKKKKQKSGRKPGRPKGSKNKKTLEREAKQKEESKQ